MHSLSVHFSPRKVNKLKYLVMSFAESTYPLVGRNEQMVSGFRVEFGTKMTNPCIKISCQL
jgi:hypothetical protein